MGVYIYFTWGIIKMKLLLGVCAIALAVSATESHLNFNQFLLMQEDSSPRKLT